jgi:hypothetical protein
LSLFDAQSVQSVTDIVRFQIDEHFTQALVPLEMLDAPRPPQDEPKKVSISSKPESQPTEAEEQTCVRFLQASTFLRDLRLLLFMMLKMMQSSS